MEVEDLILYLKWIWQSIKLRKNDKKKKTNKIIKESETDRAAGSVLTRATRLFSSSNEINVCVSTVASGFEEIISFNSAFSRVSSAISLRNEAHLKQREI